MTNGEKLKEIFPDIQIFNIVENEQQEKFIYIRFEDVCQAIELEWWNAEYKEPTTRNCFGCKYSKDNHNAGTEECHLCMWENQYTPTTKNDDCISKKYIYSRIKGMGHYEESEGSEGDGTLITYNTCDWNEVLREIEDAPSVTLQEPRWIPVTEDAPPKGTICLWCNKQGCVFTSEITYRSEYSSHVGKHGYFSNGLENYGNIVAWMPLPKPYNAESKG